MIKDQVDALQLLNVQNVVCSECIRNIVQKDDFISIYSSVSKVCQILIQTSRKYSEES